MNLQAIIQFILGNPILIILIIGGGSSVLRAFKTIKEKQTEKKVRQQIQQRRRQAELDELRTGRRSASTESNQVQSPAPVASDQQKRQQEQELKRQRIEQIREARIEQLKKIRAKRSAGTSQSPSQSGSQTGSQSGSRSRNAPAQRRASTPTPPQRQPQQRPARPQQARPAASASTPYASQSQSPYDQKQAKNQSKRPATSDRSNRNAQQAQQGIAPRRRRKTEDNQIEIGAVPVAQKSVASGVGKKIRSDLRYALIAKEVLGTPIGLRSQGEDGFGTL
ncbi:MAG: hypothetical protein ACSHX5_06285 [Phycisphaerales bacterium]